MMQLFYDGKADGPYTLEQIQVMRAAGTIPPNALYRQDSEAEWKSLDTLLSTLPHSMPSPPPPESKNQNTGFIVTVSKEHNTAIEDRAIDALRPVVEKLDKVFTVKGINLNAESVLRELMGRPVEFGAEVLRGIGLSEKAAGLVAKDLDGFYKWSAAQKDKPAVCRKDFPMKKPRYPSDWAKTRKQGRKPYAYKYGVRRWGIPMLLLVMLYTGYSEKSFYELMGSMLAALLLVPWTGYRLATKQFDKYEKAFLADGAPARVGRRVSFASWLKGVRGTNRLSQATSGGLRDNQEIRFSVHARYALIAQIMNTTTKAFCLGLAGGVIFALIVFSTMGNRYRISHAESNVLRVDSWTGETCYARNGVWNRISEASTSPTAQK